MDARPAPHDGFASSWLCPSPLERQRALELAELLGRNSTAMGLLLSGSSIVTACWTTPWALVATFAGVGFPIAARRLPRSRRPELLLFWASVVFLAGLTAGIGASGGIRSPLVFWSVFTVLGVSARCGRRGILILSAVSVAGTAGALALADPSSTVHPLPSALSLLATMTATALYGWTLVGAEFSHREAALLDPLTGLLNRKALEPRFEELRQQSVQAASDICLIMCDLDHFKHVNDTYGHVRGDAVLRDVAYEMRKSMRSFELIYRMGGEEFLVVLPGADSATGAGIAEQLRTTIASCYPGGVRVTASFGVSAERGGAVAFDTLFRHADEALYRAKADGRDRVAVAGAPSLPGLAEHAPVWAPA